jgi:class 3 adenylate cyclase
MFERVLCPTLVGREEQLFALEDALFAANRGEGRLVAIGAEAGMGKTRLATELAKRARRLGWELLWGGCSEAELAVPYQPVVEAVGNYLSHGSEERVVEQLGAARRELAQLFPQLAGDEAATPVGDPGQAKLRLFESVVALLSMPARERGLLLVLEDVHWADSATRELLDHLVRRLPKMRSLLVVTYRSDELDRRHPLTPIVQRWRRSGDAEMVSLPALAGDEIGQMISAILDDDDVGQEFRDLMHARTEGNPFVLEEMLKEAIDRGDIFRSARAWQRRSLEQLQIPASVRETILLRFGRLDHAEAETLQAAAVLGRSFEYATLLAVAGGDETTVQRALAVGVSQQLLEETDGPSARYRWRHALTQEAVAAEIVLPRRQALHGSAADVLAAASAAPVEVAGHLLGAARFDEAVPACVAAAERAEASLGFGDAVELLERALPHVRDPRTRAHVLCRMGRLLWMDAKTAAAESVLAEGVAGLEACGETLDAARYRLDLARCHWEQSRPDEAREEFERARIVLEEHGPSAELALAYMRLAGIHHFELETERSLPLARKAIEIAEAAGADFERVWAQAWLGYPLHHAGRIEESSRMIDSAFDEAMRRGFTFIAHNIAYNDAWARLHTMTPGVSERLDAIASQPGTTAMSEMLEIASSWTLRTSGDLLGALGAIERAHEDALATSSEKVRWRTVIEHAETLFELGRIDEASAMLPPVAARAELQDIVYDVAPQIRLRLVTSRLDEAVELAREVAARAGELAPYNDALAVAVEALVAAGLLDEADAVVAAGRKHPSDAGGAFLDEAEARIMLARGEAQAALPLLERVRRHAGAGGFRLVEWRVRTLIAESLAQAGSREDAQRELSLVAAEADAAHAHVIADAARDAGRRLDLYVPERTEAPATRNVVDPDLAGERLVTTMFADVRNYTSIAASTAPADLADRLATLHRWAVAEVGRRHGFVDKFAGDAVMATFNATGTRLDHTQSALEAALALSDKASMLDLGIGVGIAVGPAVVGRTVADGNVSVLGPATNLAARLQSAAAAGEVVLSDDAHRRVGAWLDEHGIVAVADALELKGFDGVQPAWRLRAAPGS